jgi:hypothetical protein
VLAFTAFASAAQASEWNIETSKGVTQSIASLGGSESVSASIPSGSSVGFIWFPLLGGLSRAEVSCSGVSAIEAGIGSGGSGVGTFKFSKCVGKGLLSECQPPSTITTSKMKFGIAESEGKKYLEFTPFTKGASIASFTVQGECRYGLGTKYTVSGSTKLIPVALGTPTVAQRLEGSPGTPLFYSEAGGYSDSRGEGNIGGTLQLQLAGKYSGDAWSAS